ncbi:putative chromosome segregation protein sudA [Catenaria anguillulae PL171]|uniref:Structural maintenance of chromosomes protein n=1 Tax=Catenaria anguillulae PL171 TaxID=765915 RepID=A0A1Y2I0C6_9FUNG|nr:putative chromosome segregation protein sudA [Catenaria anguillulae PL171]
MHIKQLIIQGFKSYKDQTVMEPFSPRHNVIVGRNGSGKSNFFWAIRFALNDAYTNLTREERQSLLHEGSGPASMSAFVEVIFDNSDHRFPTGKDEVVLRRTIGLKKDEYSLDKKSATKSEVMSLLESAGFSSANPYYIVPQGRITALCNSKDAERLQLLKEVAGTGVYESRRAESLKILDETNGKREKIEQLMTFISDRLAELEEEKKELTEYTKLDKERRALEYAMYQRELALANSELAELENNRQSHVLAAHKDRDAIKGLATKLDKAQEVVGKGRQGLENAVIDRDAAAAQVKETARQLTELELTLGEAEQANRADELRATRGELARVHAEIAQVSARLAEWTPQLDASREAKRSLDAAHDELQSRRKALAAKQGRAGQFASVKAYREWIDSQVAQLRSALENEQQRVAQLENDDTQLTQEIERIQAEADAMQAEFANVQARATELQAQLNEARERRSTLDGQRKALRTDESKAAATLAQERDRVNKLEQTLFAACDRSTAQGLRSLKEIVQRTGIEGVHGPLYELMDVPESYQTAVEVVGGTSVFQVVVEDDDVAVRLLDELRRMKPGAKLTLLPLNRLRVKEVEYPKSKGVVPMIKQIRFDPIYQLAFQQVFGRAVICQDLESATRVAKTSGLTAVTLPGDRVDRKGAMSGGYLDSEKNKLRAAMELVHAKQRVEEAERTIHEIRDQLTTLDQQITASVSDMQRLAIAQQAAQEDSSVSDWQSKKRQVAVLTENRDAIRSELVRLRQDASSHETEIRSLQEERAAGGRGGLSDQERDELQALETQVAENRAQAAEVGATFAQLQRDVDQARAQLDNRLVPTKMNLERAAADLDVELQKNDVERLRDSLRRVSTELEQANAALHEAEAAVDRARTQVEKGEQDVDKIKQQIADRQRSVDTQDMTLSRFIQQRKLVVDKRDEVTRAIRDLGVVPDDHERYANVAQSELVRMLKRAHDGLKKYAHVNKKAFEQFNNFTKQQDALEARKNELDESEDSIRDLMANLDRNKDEAIQRTFTQVAENFASVFEELVPAGRGKLVLVKADGTEVEAFDMGADASDLSDEEEDEDENGVEGDAMDVDGEEEDDELDGDESQSSTQRASRGGQRSTKSKAPGRKKGQAVRKGGKVSFNSKVDEGLHMGQLSGGQKSLVALALIFAIQQCDPAPFYLFDEIDANLDAQYRTAVANKIHDLGQNAQFITTTFRAELLAHADQFYGVSFKDKASKIQCISKEDAMGFVELGQENPSIIQ